MTADERAQLAAAIDRVAELAARFRQPFDWLAWYGELSGINYSLIGPSGAERQYIAELDAEREISRER